MYQCRFLSFDECTVVMYDINDGGNWMKSVLSLQLFCKSKTFPKQNGYLRK